MGPGVYDDLCTLVRERASAEGAIVIVINGAKGSGFSMQAPLEVTITLPSMLRTMADGIDASMRVPKA